MTVGDDHHLVTAFGPPAAPVLDVDGGPLPPRTVPAVRHELWVEDDGTQTFCRAGLMGDDARALLGATARLVWTVEAASHFEAMTRYYEHMGWGRYTSDYEETDRTPYAERGWE